MWTARLGGIALDDPGRLTNPRYLNADHDDAEPEHDPKADHGYPKADMVAPSMIRLWVAMTRVGGAVGRIPVAMARTYDIANPEYFLLPEPSPHRSRGAAPWPVYRRSGSG